MKKAIVLILMVFSLNQVQAQFFVPKKEIVKQLDGKTLIVVSVNEETTLFDTYMQRFVIKYWKFNPDILFKTESEAKELVKKEPGKYALLNWYFTQRTGLITNGPEPDEIYALGLQLHTKNDEYVTIHEIGFPDANISEFDMAFAIQHMQIDLEAGLNKLYHEDSEFWNAQDFGKIAGQKLIYLPLDKPDTETFKYFETNASYQESNTDLIMNALNVQNKETYFVTTIFSDTHQMPVWVVVKTENLEPVLFVGNNWKNKEVKKQEIIHVVPGPQKAPSPYNSKN